MLQTWNIMTLARAIDASPKKSTAECFEILLEGEQKTQRVLSREYQTDAMIRDNMIGARREIEECSFACFKPASMLEKYYADIRLSTITASMTDKKDCVVLEKTNESSFFYRPSILWNNSVERSRLNPSYFDNKHNGNCIRKCFVCKKANCWSIKHSTEERNAATEAFKKQMPA